MVRGSAARPRRAGAGWIAAGFGFLCACEVPTSPPEWETTWVIPGDSLEMPVGSLLPPAVAVADGGGAFVVAFGATVFGRALGQICAVCQALDGTTAPKPAFAATFGSTIPLPADVVSASLVGGTIDVRITNEFDFDPIHPGTAADGKLRLTVRHGGATLAVDSLDAAQGDRLPAGTTRTLALDLVAGTVAGPLEVEVYVESPTGDPAPIDASARLETSAVPGAVFVDEAEVVAADKSVEVVPVELGLADVDGELNRRIRGGALRLTLENPFAVEGSIDLRLTTLAADILKTIPLATGGSELRVEFTAAELRSIVGHTVTFGGMGTVTAPSGTVVVTPSQKLVGEARLELTLGPKEE